MSGHIKPGLKENWKQFTLLVLVNAFVGGMIGMERTIFPQFAELKFGVASKTAILSFIVAFGITKATANFYAGYLANKFGRRNLLLSGWLLAIPVPFLLIYAPAWSWVIFANILLGISQGLTWSSTVVMKIDLVGEKNRGLAMGLNEFAGYFAVGLVAFLTGYVAGNYGITPYPFYIGIFISVTGFLLTALWVKETAAFVHQESKRDATPPLDHIFLATTLKNKTLSSVTQAGFVNNLNDGMMWGLLPVFLLAQTFNNKDIGIITAIHPAVWGFGQLFTGKCRIIILKKPCFFGHVFAGYSHFAAPVKQQFLCIGFAVGHFGFGHSIGLSNILNNHSAGYKPPAACRKYRNIQILERFWLCIWSNNFRCYSRPAGHWVCHCTHWRVDNPVIPDYQIPHARTNGYQSAFRQPVAVRSNYGCPLLGIIYQPDFNVNRLKRCK